MNRQLSKIYTQHTLVMQLNLLLAIRYKEMGQKSNSKVHLSKQMLLFHLFFALYSLVCEKMYSVFEMLLLLYSIYIANFLFLTDSLLIDLVPEIIKHTERNKNNLNVTLPCQISSINQFHHHHFGLSLSIIGPFSEK